MAWKRSLPTTAIFMTTLLILLFLFTLASASSSGHGTPPISSIDTPQPRPWPISSSNWTNNTPARPSTSQSCPIDALKLGVCVDLLGNLLNITVGQPPIQPCCSLINGLVDVEAAACLCIAIKANILGINLNIPVSLTLLLNVCSRHLPPGFQCY